MIDTISESPKPNKRYRVVMHNGKHYDFGLANGKTYIDEHNEEKKANYWKRHTANKRENELISNLIWSPSLLSAYLLWGPYETIQRNAEYLNVIVKMKYHKNEMIYSR
jgi:hypothetical protein